ncbi:type II toxin-antitoxin system VapC family toxin [Streptomyces sp. NPDC005962]|uniref:type II toxin-antitoxin system VapC family toxin n=1 Tax=Streptomyces sp. NPDC005962 TaxID=3154466 RepID=UPI0033E5C498
MIYLLDTNVVAEISVRPKPDPSVVAWARSLQAHSLYLSVMTLAEVQAGVEAASDPARQARYAQALADLRSEYHGRVAEIGEREATAYLALHKSLKANGTCIDPPDALIAATALANGWTVASRNTKHLKRTGALLINPWEGLE